MQSNWKPLLKKNLSVIVEPFVDQAQTMNIVQNVFIGISMMVLSSVIGIIAYWSYQKSHFLFFAIFSLLTLIYAAKVVILITMIREKLSPTIFQLYIGSASMIGIISIFVFIFFAVKTSRRLSSDSGTSSPSMGYNP
jgi:hypothetical protein